MRHNFICEVCDRNFKTTQHLRQHINKKKKCIPIVFDKPSLKISQLETDNNNDDNDDNNNNNDNNINNTNINNSDYISMLSLHSHNKNEICNTQNSYLNINDLINLDELKDCKVMIHGIINFVLKYNMLLEENIKQEKKIKELECDNIYFKNMIDKFKNSTIDFYKCPNIY
jgi:hypothetical protein